MADRDARMDAVERLNGLAVQYAPRDANLSARLAEVAQFIASSIRSPALLAEPIPNLMDRLLLEERAREAGQKGRGTTKVRAGTLLAHEMALHQWEKWQTNPDEFDSWEAFSATVSELAREDGHELPARKLARWCGGFVKNGYVSPKWVAIHKTGKIPKELRKRFE